MIRPRVISAILYFASLAFGSGAVFAASNSTHFFVADIGDSLIVGHGVTVGSAFPNLLEQGLKAAGYDATVVANPFLSTSLTGLHWLARESSVAELAVPNTVVILELGSNDCIQFKRIPLEDTRANLDQIISQLAAKHIPVLVVGTAAYDVCGADYGSAFAKMYADLAGEHSELLYPEFKAGVLGHPELFTSDLDHPNDAGEAVIVKAILPVVEQLIARLPAP